MHVWILQNFKLHILENFQGNADENKERSFPVEEEEKKGKCRNAKTRLHISALRLRWLTQYETTRAFQGKLCSFRDGKNPFFAFRRCYL